MSRVDFATDEDRPGQFALWEANCRRSWYGKAGQKALKELRDALIALPEKALVSHVLSTSEGMVCTIGALAKAKQMPEVEALADNEDLDEYDMQSIAAQCGIPQLVAWSIIFEQDEMFDHRKTPEQRYDHMLKWVEDRIKKEAAQS